MQLTVDSKHLPVGWKVKKLAEVCQVEKIQGIHTNLPYIGMENIESNTAKFIGSTEPQTVKSLTFKFSHTHVLYGRLRPYLNKVLSPDFEGHCSTEIFPIKPNGCLNRNFLLYWLLMDSTVKRINATCTGARMPRANMNYVFEFDFPLPLLPEQKRIVAILDEAFEGIDRAIANTEKNFANSRELFESYLNAIFTQKGDGWVDAVIENHIKFVDYRGRTPNKTEEGMRLITAKNVKMGFLQTEPQEFVDPNIYDNWMTRGIPKKGDILFTTEAPLGNVAQLDTDEKVVFAQRIIIMQPDTKFINKTFLKFLLLSNIIQQRIQDKGTGATAKGIKASLLKRILISFPSDLLIQEAIVLKLETLEADTKRLEAIYKQKFAVLKELKQSILHKAFTGELTADTANQTTKAAQEVNAA